MRFFVFAAFTVAMLLVAPGHTVAQTANETGGNTTTYIDDDLGLVESGYDGETGTAFVVLQSDRPQAITISDGGALAKGSGPIATSTAVVDGRTRIEVSATSVQGRVAVVIDSDARLYGHVIRAGNQSSGLVGGPWSARDVQVAGGAGALTVAIFVIVQLVRYKRGTTHKPERIA